ncbi:MAG: SRPBCC family protein [Deltaproteobacteria bacterium]|nr:SRPBCC family protein [Deltaproteobacteria bacterium]
MGKCHHSAVISAPVEEVWQLLRNFHDLSWTAAIETLEPVGDARGDQVGARRLLNGAISETLRSLNDLELSKDDLKFYYGTVSVLPVTDENASFVSWITRFESKDDAVTQEFCDPFYSTFLAHLKARFA